MTTAKTNSTKEKYKNQDKQGESSNERANLNLPTSKRYFTLTSLTKRH
jgi:hypothetical protein